MKKVSQLKNEPGGQLEKNQNEWNLNTVEPWYNHPRYYDFPGIMINMLCPGKSYSKMHGTEPWYNDLRY